MNRNDHIAAQVAVNAKKDPKAWARRIIERVEAGEYVPQIAIDKARDALEMRRPIPPPGHDSTSPL